MTPNRRCSKRGLGPYCGRDMASRENEGRQVRVHVFAFNLFVG